MSDVSRDDEIVRKFLEEAATRGEEIRVPFIYAGSPIEPAPGEPRQPPPARNDAGRRRWPPPRNVRDSGDAPAAPVSQAESSQPTPIVAGTVQLGYERETPRYWVYTKNAASSKSFDADVMATVYVTKRVPKPWALSILVAEVPQPNVERRAMLDEDDA